MNLLFNILSTIIFTRINSLELKNHQKHILSLCKCAEQALGDMSEAIQLYQNQVRNNKEKSPDMREIVQKIKTIAHECTKRPDCRCPEGYVKTSDGLECLKISDNETDCKDAEKICGNDFNARLAIAKDHNRLQKLADYIREMNGPRDEHYYWIGLSYNRTRNGYPGWVWSDGTRATEQLKRDMNLDVKK